MINEHEQRGYLSEDFRLFHLSGPPAPNISYHYHEFHKLLLLKSGSGTYTLNGKRYSVNAGDIIFVGSRCVHKPEFDGPYERIILYISPEYLRNVSTVNTDLSACFELHEGQVLRMPQLSHNKIYKLAEDLEKALSAETFGQDILCRSYLLLLLVELNKSNALNHYLSPVYLTTENKRILDIMNYIKNHLTEDLTVDRLSEQFYISKYHLMHQFRRETGITLHGYISDIRLHKAKELMEQHATATDACFQAGFKTYSSFTRAYAKRYGCTPTGRAVLQGPSEESYE